MILSMNYLTIFTGYFVVGSAKTYVLTAIPDEGFLSLVSSIGGLFGAMRFIWSALLDKFSYKTIYGILIVLQGSLICLLPFIVTTFESLALKKGLYATIVFLVFFCEGGHFVLAPTIYKKIFGLRGGIRVWSVGYAFSGLASLTIIVIDTFLLQPLGFGFLCFLYVGFNLVALFILFFLFEEKRVLKQ
mmetsp:Transcript_3310/g.5499  ORF Transcript_3310/g.5499 Transcript_3310/m.5499 type:complete len:188 (+) Transcript_3310:1133-1696(+)